MSDISENSTFMHIMKGVKDDMKDLKADMTAMSDNIQHIADTIVRYDLTLYGDPKDAYNNGLSHRLDQQYQKIKTLEQALQGCVTKEELAQKADRFNHMVTVIKNLVWLIGIVGLIALFVVNEFNLTN